MYSLRVNLNILTFMGSSTSTSDYFGLFFFFNIFLKLILVVLLPHNEKFLGSNLPWHGGFSLWSSYCVCVDSLSTHASGARPIDEKSPIVA